MTKKGVEVNWHESQKNFRVSCKDNVDIHINFVSFIVFIIRIHLTSMIKALSLFNKIAGIKF